MTDIARQEEKIVSWQEMNLMQKLVAVDELLPHDITDSIPRHLSQEQFKMGLKAAKNIERKGALWWGQLYKVGVEIYGQDFYQMLDGFDYQQTTLQNYARLTDQIHPDLWSEEIPDRHFMAIGQNVDSLEDQRRWVEHVKKAAKTNTPISADDLRKEIHADLEERGLRQRPVTAKWHTCERCNGEGGWPESLEM